MFSHRWQKCSLFNLLPIVTHHDSCHWLCFWHIIRMHIVNCLGLQGFFSFEWATTATHKTKSNYLPNCRQAYTACNCKEDEQCSNKAICIVHPPHCPQAKDYTAWQKPSSPCSKNVSAVSWGVNRGSLFFYFQIEIFLTLEYSISNKLC